MRGVILQHGVQALEKTHKLKRGHEARLLPRLRFGRTLRCCRQVYETVGRLRSEASRGGEFRAASQAFPSIGAFHATVGDDSAIHPLHRIGCIGAPFD